MDMLAEHRGMDATIAAKVRRLQAGGKPRVLDLFSGCGGISLGFQRAGFEIVGNLEFDALAARSHALNFHKHVDPDVAALHAKARDITKLEPEQFADELNIGPVERGVDVIVGGPPCQAYARVGRAKLREIADHPQAFRVDPRANLYLRYLAYVKAFRPMALLMENVPDVLNVGGHNIVQEMLETLGDYGYDGRYSLINSAFHGVPQMRDRVFLLAIHKDLGAEIQFPRATRHMRLPPGYAGTRAVALKLIDLLDGSGYVHPDLGDSSLPFAVTALEALGDLLPIRGDSVKRGARRFSPETFTPYRNDVRPSSFALDMRTWPGFGASGVLDHAIRFLPRDGAIFSALPEGAEYPEAHRLAVTLFEQKARELGLTPDSPAWGALRAQRVPPYDPAKFPNKWNKLRRDFPARTLTAHLGKDCYSHIHYDGDQARTISVREGARLQSFPDGFVFAGTMNPALKQIGNAVPPLMATAMATALKTSIMEAISALDPMLQLDVLRIRP